MTMAMAAPLQTALYERLVVLPALGGRVFDDAPHQSADVGGAYVTLGDETVAPWDTVTDRGAIHAVRVRGYSPVRGFLPAKALAADVVAVLDEAPLTLSRGKVITQVIWVRCESRLEAELTSSWGDRSGLSSCSNCSS